MWITQQLLIEYQVSDTIWNAEDTKIQSSAFQRLTILWWEHMRLLHRACVRRRQAGTQVLWEGCHWNTPWWTLTLRGFAHCYQSPCLLLFISPIRWLDLRLRGAWVWENVSPLELPLLECRERFWKEEVPRPPSFHPTWASFTNWESGNPGLQNLYWPWGFSIWGRAFASSVPIIKAI